MKHQRFHTVQSIGAPALISMCALFMPSMLFAAESLQSEVIEIDDSRVKASYVNVCTIRGTSDDVVFDLAFVAGDQESQAKTISARYRVVTNYYVAKRIANGLALTINRHEGTFGEIQTVGRRRPSVDGRSTEPEYANFCRMTGTPEEIILDFGLNPQPVGVPTQPVSISRRIVVNFRTGKQLSGDLAARLKEHEAKVGVIETDVYKRIKPQPQLR